VVQATPAYEAEIIRALDLRGVPATALKIVGQAPPKAVYATGRQFNASNFKVAHGCLAFSREIFDKSLAKGRARPRLMAK
jgi:hypothetical protein